MVCHHNKQPHCASAPGAIALILVVAGAFSTPAWADSGSLAAHDPGPRPNPASPIPKPISKLTLNEAALFNESLLRVSELEGTCDTCAQQPPNVLPIDPSPTNPFSPTSLVNSAGMGQLPEVKSCSRHRNSSGWNQHSAWIRRTAWSVSRGALQVSARRDARWRCAQPIYSAGSIGCAQLHAAAAGFQRGSRATQLSLSDSIAALRSWFDRVHSRQSHRCQHERQSRRQVRSRNQRTCESSWE